MTRAAESPLRLIRRAIPNHVSDLRVAVRKFAEQAGVPPGRAADVELAVSEAVTNAVVHAYPERPGVVRVVAEQSRRGIVVAVEDDGDGLRRSRPETAGLGFGLPIMSQLADDFQLTTGHDGRGTRVLLAFSYDGSGTPGDGLIPLEFRDPANPLPVCESATAA